MNLLLVFSSSDAHVALVVLYERGHRPASQPHFLYEDCCFLGAGTVRENAKLLLPSFRAFFASSVRRLRRWRANSLHSKRKYLTVWFPCLHSHLPSSIPGHGLIFRIGELRKQGVAAVLFMKWHGHWSVALILVLVSVSPIWLARTAYG